ncbi:AAA family ATPase [Mucilaginibacter ginsenosidivorax]|uniref:AAA family ATPase n=1 Tax=Mucilaginibacter ginsenosidivorax TaxID=862126 RepID=A0A5B8W3I3_9SPHI|nr:ATP-binding protein [Mucilaginibacter ginsenosidivorax]QEC78283.1 AAA family ATPase [Mucilaginibacter ginsenosidivorax]
MFLKQITLHNFKCLEDITLSFRHDGDSNRKWTLILGENGTGKSNLLKAIALITCGSNALGELLGNANSWIRNGARKCTVDAIIETKKNEERSISLTIKRDDTLSDVILNNRKSLELIDNAIFHADRNYFVVAYGASRRLSADSLSLEKAKYGRYNNVRNLFYNNYPLNNLTSWIIDLDYQSGESGLDIVKNTLNDFLPGTTFHEIDKMKKQVLFETSDGIVPLDQLSDGYQNMAAWIGDLLYRVTQNFHNNIDPLQARGVLLIDEVDLHLHPRWQRNLLEFISKKLPNFQVIGTTHSPLTAQQADVHELYALKRNEKNRVKLIPFKGSPRNLLINQLLMTPVFGLETDESLEIENTKKEYESLKKRIKSLNAQEKEHFEEVKLTLQKNLPIRDMPPYSQKEFDLLEKIESQLSSR